MNTIWWWYIRRQLGLPSMTWYEMADELQQMSLVDIEMRMEEAMYGRIEEDNVHPYSDERFWLSSIPI